MAHQSDISKEFRWSIQTRNMKDMKAIPCGSLRPIGDTVLLGARGNICYRVSCCHLGVYDKLP